MFNVESVKGIYGILWENLEEDWCDWEIKMVVSLLNHFIGSKIGKEKGNLCGGGNSRTS